MIEIEVEGFDRLERILQNLAENAAPAVTEVLQDTARDIEKRFQATAPRGRTGRLHRAARYRRTAGGALVRVAVRHGKPSEARNPAFNRAIKSALTGVRSRIRGALKKAAG